MYLSLKLAIRFLFSSRLGSFSSYASWLAIGGLSIGVTALMLTASIIEGFQDIVSEKLESFEGHERITHILGKSINISSEGPHMLVWQKPGVEISRTVGNEFENASSIVTSW